MLPTLYLLLRRLEDFPNTAPGVTFRAQAEKWIAPLPTRRRKPVKPATIVGWRSVLDNWVPPNIGDKPLSDVSNGEMRGLIERMEAGGLSAKTFVNYAEVVKLVAASAVDPNGKQIYPRKWNHDFIGLPIVEPHKQRRPTVSKQELEQILSVAGKRWQFLSENAQRRSGHRHPQTACPDVARADEA
jgi:hypothetical protein